MSSATQAIEKSEHMQPVSLWRKTCTEATISEIALNRPKEPDTAIT
jgi:hypothetical protein